MTISLLLAVLSLAGWRGETVNFRPAADVKIGAAPAGVTVREGVLREVRYVTKPHGTEYASAADRVEWDAKDASAPRVAQVVIAPDAKPGVYAMGDVELRVVDRVLPPPRQWKYFLGGMWHHPWAIARLTKTEPWSEAHLAECRKFLKMSAAIGSRVVMATLSDLPWNHQCYDANLTMVRHVKHLGTGEWTFDYSVFDKWVALSLETGNGPMISCYSLVPWGYEVYWEDETGHPNRVVAKPGTKEFADYWGPFLHDFEKHLRAKGWLEQAALAFDERSPEDVKAIHEFLKKEGLGLRLAASCNAGGGQFADVKVAVHTQILNKSVDDAFCAAARRRYEEGRGATVCYTCCYPRCPNTFVWSDPDDAFWLGVMPIAKGMQGYSRWTFDSWPKDPMKDASYSFWDAGDTYFAYPDGSPSIRYLMLQNGVQNGEKWRILRDAGVGAAELAALAKKYDIPSALKKRDGDFRALVDETKELLNRLGSAATTVVLSNRLGRAEVSLLGAQVLSYVPAGRSDVLFMPEDRDFSRDREMHGGIPVCWPWFARLGAPGSRLHGVARYCRWQVAGLTNGTDVSRLVLTLDSSDATRKAWPHDFRLEYEIVLTDRLSLVLKAVNTGRDPFDTTFGFHPYFRVGNPDGVVVRGLKDPIRAHPGINDVYERASGGTYAFDGANGPVEVSAAGERKLIVWNPGPNWKGWTPTCNLKADDWRRFLCVEPAVIGRENAQRLRPGESSTLKMTLRDVPRQ